MAVPAQKPQTAVAPAPKIITPVEEIKAALDQMETEITQGLPTQMQAKKFLQYAKIQVEKDSKLVNSDRQSLYAAIREAAQDGLYLDGREATILVFNENIGTKESPRWIKRAKYLPMVHGILKKVRNSGELASLASQVVYKNDKFKSWVDDTGEHIEHSWDNFNDRGEMVGVYAMARTKDGNNFLEVMSVAQVEAVKSKSKAQDSLMWTTFKEEGWRKSVVKRLSKRLPMSSDLAMVLDRDNDIIDLESETPAPTPAKPTSSRLKAAIKPTATQPAEVEAEEPPPTEEEPPEEDQVPV